MNKKKIIIILTILIVSLCAIITIYNFNKNSEEDAKSKIIVSNNLSINFIEGDIISSSLSDKSYVFSVSNNSNEDMFYQIDFETFSENITNTYSLKCEETMLENNNMLFVTGSIMPYSVIKPGDTHTYVLTVNKGEIKKQDIGKISVNKYNEESSFFAQYILENNEINQQSKTKVGSEVSVENEGLIQDIDDGGICYYFRGNVNNNYVHFANLTWRILRINGNNTIRLILDSNIEGQTSYYDTFEEKNISYINSNVKSQLDNWYKENLSSFDKYIASIDVCNDTKYTAAEEYIFNSNQRLTVNQNPTLNCMGSVTSSKISILSADEIEYAGGLIGVANNNYFLYNSNIYNSSWTLTPSKGSALEYYPYVLSSNGSIEDNNIGTYYKSIRPVINIIKRVNVSGTGTIDDPYEVIY